LEQQSLGFEWFKSQDLDHEIKSSLIIDSPWVAPLMAKFQNAVGEVIGDGFFGDRKKFRAVPYSTFSIPEFCLSIATFVKIRANFTLAPALRTNPT